MSPIYDLNTLVPLLWSSALALLWTLAGLILYGILFDRTIFEGQGRVQAESFSPVDLFIGLILAGLFLAQTFAAPVAKHEDKLPSASAMVAAVILSTLFFGLLAAGIIGTLIWRGLPWRRMLGFERDFALGTVGRAALLLGGAVPLVTAGLLVSNVLLRASGREYQVQDTVRFLNASGDLPARLMLAFSAVCLAPIQEEFMFRGYLYGVFKRFLGPAGSMVLVSLLFAGIHQSASAFGGLFVLAMCLALAYEWTGSLFVSMTMHALFNAINVASIFHGGV